jgi:hypothetical protein
MATIHMAASALEALETGKTKLSDYTKLLLAALGKSVRISHESIFVPQVNVLDSVEIKYNYINDKRSTGQRAANPMHSTITSDQFPRRLLPTLARYGFVDALLIMQEVRRMINNIPRIFTICEKYIQ